MTSTRTREWSDEELVREIRKHLEEHRSRQRSPLDPLAGLEWLLSKSLLTLERLVRRLLGVLVR